MKILERAECEMLSFDALVSMFLRLIQLPIAMEEISMVHRLFCGFDVAHFWERVCLVKI